MSLRPLSLEVPLGSSSLLDVALINLCLNFDNFPLKLSNTEVLSKVRVRGAGFADFSLDALDCVSAFFEGLFSCCKLFFALSDLENAFVEVPGFPLLDISEL
jgi:hypothetical protein